jgi:hypothetical protein
MLGGSTSRRDLTLIRLALRLHYRHIEVRAPRPLWAELELSESDYLDESLAPEVDEALRRGSER